MNKRLCIGILAAVASCQEDTLSRQAPQLIVKPYEDTNTAYESVDKTATPLTINLGDVAVYSTRKAHFWLENPTNMPLIVHSATYTADTVGGDWLAPIWVKDRNDLTGKPLPLSVPPFEKRILSVPFSPAEEGAASAIVEIESDAENGVLQFVKVTANGVYQGAPDVEIEYNGIIGPRPVDCVDVDTDSVIDGCTMVAALDFGGVGLGGSSSARLFIRNASTCAPYPGSSPCETCVLTVDRDQRRADIGLGFKPGTNDQGYFAFQGSTATPFSLPQDETGCTLSNFVRPVITFAAPESEGTYETVVIVETNDPDEPMIEIPVRASAVNAPIAIAKFKAFDPMNPSAPFTDPDEIEPYERVYLDGRAMGNINSSHDPRDPANASLIQSYQWELVGPTGVDIAQYEANPPGMNAALFDFVTPLAGHYVAKLTVRNDAGLSSLETSISQVEFDAIPRDRMHIQVVWDDPTNDQDLHLTSVNNDDRVCNQPWDCHWLNRQPTWFGGVPGAGPNPVLDVDDTNGLGPENINIEDPVPGVYRIYVHYYGDHNFSGNTPTRNTVRIFLNGIQVAEYARTLVVEKAVWAVADVTWNADNTGFVTPYPSDSLGEPGSVANMQDCSTPGWTMP